MSAAGVVGGACGCDPFDCDYGGEHKRWQLPNRVATLVRRVGYLIVPA